MREYKKEIQQPNKTKKIKKDFNKNRRSVKLKEKKFKKYGDEGFQKI